MRIKPLLPYIGIALFALIVGLAAGYLNLHQQPPVPVAKSGPATTLMLLRPARALPDFTLKTRDARPFTRDSLRGHWSLLYFGYTHCPDVCPTTLADLARMTASLKTLPPASRPRVVFISVDPKRDSLPALDKYVSYFSPDFVAATGALDQLKRLTAALGIMFSYEPPDQSAGYAVGHSAAVLLIDPQAREAAVFTPPLAPKRMADDYRFVLKLGSTPP